MAKLKPRSYSKERSTSSAGRNWSPSDLWLGLSSSPLDEIKEQAKKIFKEHDAKLTRHHAIAENSCHEQAAMLFVLYQEALALPGGIVKFVGGAVTFDGLTHRSNKRYQNQAVFRRFLLDDVEEKAWFRQRSLQLF